MPDPMQVLDFPVRSSPPTAAPSDSPSIRDQNILLKPVNFSGESVKENHANGSVQRRIHYISINCLFKSYDGGKLRTE